MKMSNMRNQLVYRLWAPIYDGTVGRFFLPGRRRAMELLNLKMEERVLLAGVGTGEDLQLLPEGVCATGVDLSADMLAKARGKINESRAKVLLVRGDAQVLPVKPESFDAAILNLILSVVPDGRLCLQSALRALKPGGRAVIFDKFLSSEKPSAVRRLLNYFSTMAGTDINRSLSGMMQDAGCRILHDEASIAGGVYRVILIEKTLPGAGFTSPE